MAEEFTVDGHIPSAGVSAKSGTRSAARTAVMLFPDHVSALPGPESGPLVLDRVG
jgi:hypothetical protein